MWKRYVVKLQMTGRFAASIPKTDKEIMGMLEHRMPASKPEGAMPVEELAEQVAAEVGAEPEIGWATFKRDDKGLYYEGRCIRGHIKDCAQQVAPFFPAIRAFKSKVANKVYVEDEKIYLDKSKPDGYEQRFIQVMTKPGPRSTYKFLDYVEKPELVFTLKVLEDGIINREILEAIFEYGGTHGMGQERGQSWGRYEVKELKEV